MTPEQKSRAALRSAFYAITAAAHDTAERCNRLSIDAGNNWRDAYTALEVACTTLEDADDNDDNDEYMAAAARACGRATAAAEKSASEWGEVYTALISAYQAAAMRSAKKPGRKNAAGF